MIVQITTISTRQLPMARKVVLAEVASCREVKTVPARRGSASSTYASHSPTNTSQQYGKDTLRPVTIKQLIDAEHPHADAEHFLIDGSETTQVTFVGQIRNISYQATNVTYKLDDGTGTFEVKVWVDSEQSNHDDPNSMHAKLSENAYARVWGKLKTFGKKHVVAHIVRPITDYNEINYHLLEATYVHLFFSRGPLDQLQNKSGANGANGQQQGNDADGGYGGNRLPATATSGARKVYQCISNTPQTNEGLHMQDIAMRTQMEVADVLKAGDELQGMGLIYTTVDDHTWALLVL